MDVQQKTPIKLIVTDVDGTFLPKTRILTPRTHDALKLLDEQGIAVVLASSRPPRGMEFVLEQAGFLQRDLPVVSMNGALITTTQGMTLFSSLLDAEIIEEMYNLTSDLAVKGGLNFMLLDAEEWWSSGDDEFVRREETSLRFAPVIATPEMLRERVKSPANKVTLLGDVDAVQTAKSRILERFGETLTVASPFNPRFLDITAKNVHKGTALERLSVYMNVPTAQICALGDGENDVDMFRVAGTSVVMGHAHDTVKVHATHLTDSHTDDGWANAIFRLFGN